jgi:TfoX/Sxy family transcriptional regulator of competence genes
MAYDEKTAERLRKVLAGRRDVVEKKMMGGLCFMAKGGMSCSVSGRGGLLVRVDPQAYENMLLEPHVAPVEMRGRVMRGFVRVAPDGYRTEAALKRWVERGLNAAAARPAKAGRSKAKGVVAKKKRRVG